MSYFDLVLGRHILLHAEVNNTGAGVREGNDTMIGESRRGHEGTGDTEEGRVRCAQERTAGEGIGGIENTTTSRWCEVVQGLLRGGGSRQ